MAEPAVRFEGISKRFPGALALSDVSLAIEAGSCHALCGENGAGKSTLGKILAGIHAPDAGRLFLRGREVRFAGPRDALAAGVGMVHQELAFCGNISVAENLCLGALPARAGWVAWREVERRAIAMLEEIGADLDVRRPLGELTIAQQQLVQIAAAVGGGARIIVFDEPTSSLSQVEAERLYELIRRLKRRGVTCIYVSHRMPEIFGLCDTVSVLRDGRHVATRPTAGLSEAELVGLMIGRPLAEYFPRHLEAAAGEEVLRVEHLSCPGKFEDVSFSLRAGEVVGLAGLVGAGRSEVARALFGLERGVRGRILVDGRPVRIASPRHAIRLGIGLVPEDRKRQGLVLTESGLHNTSLPILRRLARLAWIRRARERRLAAEYFQRLRVRAPGLDAPIASLSGGNQQKIVLARWLAARSRILILDEPTRGVDVGAKAEIHALVDQLAAQGTAVLLISSELPEIIALSGRILVLRAGRLVGEVPRALATQDRLLALMAGVDAAVVAAEAGVGSAGDRDVPGDRRRTGNRAGDG
ncbi:MAG: sugar ABC transporter ATP-binding protein [Gemmatimonadetes bacterium]|nr:sugar ABC transporter ATP-binding protein [Gemmatimonadota bacterium]